MKIAFIQLLYKEHPIAILIVYCVFIRFIVPGAGNLTTLKLTSKGRAPCACRAGGLRDAGSMVVW